MESRVTLLAAGEAWEQVLTDLGPDLGEHDADDGDAVIGALLRRAASIRCPCPRPALVDALSDSVGDLAPDGLVSREKLDRILEELLAAGDLIELPGDTAPVLFLAPPRFMSRRHSLLVMGGVPDASLPLPPDLEPYLGSRGVHRILSERSDDAAIESLVALGYFSYPLEAWTAAPEPRRATELIGVLDRQLRLAGRSGNVPELVVMAETDSSAYYRRRWRPPGGLNGSFVGRRPQRWGAPLWCYVELEEGSPIRLLDLPSVDSRFRACDEAWWIQFAIDAVRSIPQELVVGPEVAGRRNVSVRMPLPGWAVRRLLLVGELAPRSEVGFLFTYSLPADEVDQEIEFLSDHLWGHRIDATGSTT